MIRKSTLITLTLVAMLIITKSAQADVDCNAVTGGAPGLTGPVPISFTFNSLIDFTEEDHNKVQLFYEESVWELGGGLKGFITYFFRSVFSPNKNGDAISRGKVIATDVDYQGRSGGLSGTFIGHSDGSTGDYEEYDMWKGEGELSGLLIKLYVPVQEFSTTPSGDLIFWGCATIQ